MHKTKQKTYGHPGSTHLNAVICLSDIVADNNHACRLMESHVRGTGFIVQLAYISNVSENIK